MGGSHSLTNILLYALVVYTRFRETLTTGSYVCQCMLSEAGPRSDREWLVRWSHRCIGSVLGLILISGTAAAAVGSGLCGTPISRLLNEAGPLVVSIVMLGGTLFSMVLHGSAGLLRDPEEVRHYRKWRTRSVKGVLGAPILGYFLEVMLGYLGLNVDSCIDIVPFL